MKLFVFLAFFYVIITLCNGDSRESLLLSPLIRAGNTEEARSASRVGSLQPDVDVESYSGFITVNTGNCIIQMFFWYFPAESNTKSVPLVMSLEGGPGDAIGNLVFDSHGPWRIKEDNVTLEKRDYYWSQKYNVLFIDSPVGAGFSYTTNDTTCYSTNQTQAAKNLYETLVQFYEVFPELKKVELFVTGMSYGGKFATSLAYKIHIENQKADFKMNLKGVAVASAFIDPPNMMPHAYADYLYIHGLIDNNTRQTFREREIMIDTIIKTEEWDKGMTAFIDYNDLILSVIKVDIQNYLYYPSDPHLNKRYKIYTKMDAVRAALHVGDSDFDRQALVLSSISREFLMSVRNIFEILLEEGYRMLVYNGQVDILMNYQMTLSFLNNLQWNGANIYKIAPRTKWFVDNELAGYTKKVNNLVEALVRNAGHAPPADQPKLCLDLISRFVEDKLQ